MEMFKKEKEIIKLINKISQVAEVCYFGPHAMALVNDYQVLTHPILKLPKTIFWIQSIQMAKEKQS